MPTLKLENDHQLNFQDQGRGRPLMLFNGATLPLTFWDPIVDRLQNDFRLIRFDQRNAGDTVFEGTFTLDDTAADAVAVLDHLGIASVTVVGHAWGGRAAQVFARNYPERLDAMIICGTGGQLPATVAPETLAALRDAAKEGRRDDWEAALEATYCAAGFRNRDPDRFANISRLLWGKRPAGKARWDPTVSASASYWGMSAARTLLIYGREDRNGTPENAEHLQRQLADAQLAFIEGAGHFVIQEKPELVSRLIREFLADDV